VGEGLEGHAVTIFSPRAKASLARRMVPVAASLACTVREEDATSIGELLDGFTKQELYGLVVVLSALVPVDSPVGDLLAWADWSEEATAIMNPPQPVTRDLRPCGTTAAWARHYARGELPCDPCRQAKAVDSAERKARRQQEEASAA
jgi:hypothetical protein